MKLSQIQKKQLGIYVIIAYGITFLMGLPMGLGYNRGLDVSVFPNAQMMYPAAGVMLAYLITEKGKAELPKRFFITYLAATVLMLASAVGSVLLPDITWMGICNLVMVGGSVLAWIMLLT